MSLELGLGPGLLFRATDQLRRKFSICPSTRRTVGIAASWLCLGALRPCLPLQKGQALRVPVQKGGSWGSPGLYRPVHPPAPPDSKPRPAGHKLGHTWALPRPACMCESSHGQVTSAHSLVSRRYGSPPPGPGQSASSLILSQVTSSGKGAQGMLPASPRPAGYLSRSPHHLRRFLDAARPAALPGIPQKCQYQEDWPIIPHI